MNTTMKQNRTKVAAAHINAALAEVRRAAIEDAIEVIWAQVMMYENLLESKEAWAIYIESNTKWFLKLHETRHKLTSKKNMLITITDKLSKLKWEEQEEQER